jgi:mono/diheme cytochrome c family protein
MHDQPRFEPLEASSFFRDGRSARPLVPGTVARGRLFEDEHLYQGRVGGELAATFPIEVTLATLQHGRERYDIFCSPCHAYDGSGDGMIVRRGMRRPTSFHAERLVKSPPGYFFDVITHGFGAMYDYADRVPAEDRWAIVAYIRALQRSRTGTRADLTPEQALMLADTGARPGGQDGR